MKAQNENIVRILLLLLLCSCILLLQMQTGLVLEVLKDMIKIVGAFIMLMIVSAFAYSCMITLIICILVINHIFISGLKELKEKDELN